ncbi:MAG: hypothetical protein ABIK28_05225, partial [Planctomycetota bacterium]
MKKGSLAAFLYLLFAVFFVFNGLFSNESGICIDSLYTIKPWDSLPFAEESLVDYNPSHEFQAFFVYPWLRYTLDHLKNNDIPHWTHLSGGGCPFMGNLSCACFYPLNWLGLLIPLTLFFSLAGLIKLWCSAVFTYTLLRLYKLRFMSALFGGFAFGFSGFQICWMNHPHSNVVLFLPALFLTAEFLMKKRNGLAVSLNAVVIGLQILGGSPETSFVLCLAWILYLAYRISNSEGLLSSTGLRLFGYSLFSGLLGVGLVAFQFWPFAEYLAHSYGADIRVEEWGHFLNGGPERLLSPFGLFMGLLFPVFIAAFFGFLQRKNTIFVGVWSGLVGGLCLIVALRICFWLGAKPHMLMQVLPDLYGSWTGDCKNVGNISYSALNGGYASVLAAFLALYTFMAPCKRRPVPFFMLLFVFSFGAAHSIPWLTHFLKCIPFLGWVHNSCLLSLTAFAVAVIAPFGLEDLIFRAANLEGRSSAVAGVLGAVFVVAWAILVSGWNFFETGVDLVEAEHDPNPKITISTPDHGSIHTGLKPLQIRGRALAEVDQVLATMDQTFVGRKRTISATGSGFPGARQEERPLHADETFPADSVKFPNTFEYDYPMATVDEGTYKIVVQPYYMGGSDRESEGEDWVDIRVVRPKFVTDKDKYMIFLSLLAFLLLLQKKIPSPARATLAVLVLVVDLGFFGYGYNKTSKAERIFPSTAVTDFLKEKKGPFRIFAEGGVMPPNTNFMYNIEHMEWDDRLGVAGYSRLCDFVKLDDLAKPKKLNVFNFNVNDPLFDLMGMKYVLIKSDVDLHRHLEKFKLVFDGDVKIYENSQARERAFIVGDWINLEDLPLEDVRGENLRDLPVYYTAPPVSKGGAGSVEIETYEDEYVKMGVEADSPCLLVLTDNYYPGWRAWVDEE